MGISTPFICKFESDFAHITGLLVVAPYVSSDYAA